MRMGSSRMYCERVINPVSKQTNKQKTTHSNKRKGFKYNTAFLSSHFCKNYTLRTQNEQGGCNGGSCSRARQLPDHQERERRQTGAECCAELNDKRVRKGWWGTNNGVACTDSPIILHSIQTKLSSSNLNQPPHRGVNISSGITSPYTTPKVFQEQTIGMRQENTHPSHPQVVVMLIFVPRFDERKGAIIARQVSCQANQHLSS